MCKFFTCFFVNTAVTLTFTPLLVRFSTSFEVDSDFVFVTGILTHTLLQVHLAYACCSISPIHGKNFK